jgi:hypothetical protein
MGVDTGEFSPEAALELETEPEPEARSLRLEKSRDMNESTPTTIGDGCICLWAMGCGRHCGESAGVSSRMYSTGDKRPSPRSTSA